MFEPKGIYYTSIPARLRRASEISISLNMTKRKRLLRSKYRYKKRADVVFEPTLMGFLGLTSPT